MAQHVVLLRGINLGARNRIAMPELRELLADSGFDEVRTYLQSGNVVLRAEATPDAVARECERLIADRFGLDIRVVVRTRDELAAVVRKNPLDEVADNPKRHQVTFLDAEIDSETRRELEAAAVEPERVAVAGREIHAWHPDGVGRSPLATFLARRDLGVTGTARNWTTVTKLLDMADE